VWTYSGTPTAGDCTSANYGHVAQDISGSTANIYDCKKSGGSAAWVLRATGGGGGGGDVSGGTNLVTSGAAVMVDSAGVVTQAANTKFVNGVFQATKNITGTGLFETFWGAPTYDNLGLFQYDSYTDYGLVFIAAGSRGSAGMWNEYLKTRSADGNTNGAVSSGDEIMLLRSLGDDGTNIWNVAATIGTYVDGTVASASIPGRISFSTTKIGSSYETLAVSIKNTGNVIISDEYAESNIALDVRRSGSTGTFRLWDQVSITGTTNGYIRAGAGQSGNLLTFQDSSGSTLTGITSAGAFTGNAATATTLATARAINGVSFDGSAPITITANLPANPAACSAGQYVTDTDAAGVLTCAQVAYSQVSGTPTLAAVATSGSAADLSTGTLPAGRMPALTGDVTTSVGTVATTVSKINGTSLAGLATGLLKNTTATGVPSIAVAGTDYVVPAGNVATATALAANGTNCSAGSYPLGVDASGNAESCTAAATGTVTSVGWTGGIVSVATGTSTPAFTISGTSGGIPYFSSSSTWASSSALAANTFVMGGGAGAAPTTAAGYTVSTAGSSGGTNYNEGTSTSLARADHQHVPAAVGSVTPVTVNTNTTSDQNLMVLTIPAGALNQANRHTRFRSAGVYTTQTSQTPTVTLKVKLCTVSGCGSGTVITLATWTSAATTAAASNMPWNFDINLAGVTTGATGTVEAHGSSNITLTTTASGTTTTRNDTNTAASSAIDLTGTLYLQTTITFSTNAATANTASQRMASLNFMN
jgi:hypothetical protein